MLVSEFINVPIGHTKRQYGRVITKDNAMNRRAVAMTIHEAERKMNAEKGS